MPIASLVLASVSVYNRGQLLNPPCNLLLLFVGGVPHAAKAINIVAEADIGVAGILVVAIAGPARLGAELPGSASHGFGLTGLGSWGGSLWGSADSSPPGRSRCTIPRRYRACRTDPRH